MVSFLCQFRTVVVIPGGRSEVDHGNESLFWEVMEMEKHFSVGYGVG